MKKLFTLLTMLVLGIGSSWADVLSSATVGAYFTPETPVMTYGATKHTITKDGSGNISISTNSGTFGPGTGSRFTCTLVIKMNVPETTTAGLLCDFRTAVDTYSKDNGLYFESGRKLHLAYDGGKYPTSSSGYEISAGEHTIVYTTSDNGGYAYVDGTQKLYNSGLKVDNNYIIIYIPAAYASYITEVHFYPTVQSTANIASISTECSNHIYASKETGESVTVPSGKMLIIDADANLSKFSGASEIAIAYGKTLTLNNDNSSISLSGSGTALQSSNITTTVTGSLTEITLKATAGTLKYTGGASGEPTLNGTTLSGVTLAGKYRIKATGDITIEDLAGNDQSTGSDTYAFYTSENVNVTLKGNCDFTKKSDGTTAATASRIGVHKGGVLTIADNANVKVGKLFNSDNKANDASITIGSGATLETGICYAPAVTNNGTLTMSGTLTTDNLILNEGSTINIGGSNLSGATTVSGDATLNATSNFTITHDVTVAESKTLTIDGGSNTVNFTGTASGAGNIILSYFPTAATHPTLNDWKGTFEFASPALEQADLAAIFNAWGNENSTIKLNSVAGWFPGLAEGKEFTVYPTLDILENQTLTINNGSSNTQPVLKKITGAGILEQTWSGGSNYTLKIGTLTGFTGTLKGTNKTIVVEKLVVSSAPYANTRLIKTSGTVTLNTLYVGEYKYENYAWEHKTVGEVEGIYITEAKTVSQMQTQAVSIIGPYFAKVGEGTGNYTVTLGETAYTNMQQCQSAIEGWSVITDCKIPTVTLNQPTAGYYRILNKATGRYVNCTKVDGVVTKTSAGITGDDNSKTIFYIDSEKDIQAYDNGAYWKGVYRMGRGTFDGGTFGTLTYKHPWQFVEGNSLGTYKLIYGNDTEGKYHATGEGEATGYAELNTDAANADKATWTLVAVNELPARTAAGSADRGNEISLAPAETTVDASVPNVLVLTSTAGVVKCVNLQLDDDIIAQLGAISFTGTNVTYTRAATSSQWGTVCLPYKPAKVDGVDYYELSGSSDKSLTFTKVAYEYVAKDTPYMFKKTTSGDVSATAEDVDFFSLGGNPKSGSEVGDEVKYHLVGIMKNSSIVDGVNETQPKTGYAKIVDANAYYFKNSDNKFYPLKDRFSMKAFRCYLTTTDANARQSVLGFAVDDEGSTTGVNFIESEDGKTVDVIFDTTGRRQHQLQKGINIVNGKKIFK